MPRILVVEDSPTQAMQLRILLEDAGFETEIGRNGMEGLDAVGRAVPDAVLTDLDMPEMNGLELVEAIRGQYPSVPVILMTALGSEEIAAQALRKGAASYVPKRYLDRDIVPVINIVLGVSQAARDQHRVLEYLARTEFHYRVENDPVLVPHLIGHIREHVARMRLCDETELIRVGMALNEALLNAMYHGNLEVDSELRQDDERTFHAMAARRRTESPYCDRRVDMIARISPSQSVYIVRDEGSGFDPASLPDPSDPTNLDRIGGRGLMLIQTFMDEVTHNPAGNEITMVKRSRVV